MSFLPISRREKNLGLRVLAGWIEGPPFHWGIFRSSMLGWYVATNGPTSGRNGAKAAADGQITLRLSQTLHDRQIARFPRHFWLLEHSKTTPLFLAGFEGRRRMSRTED